MYFVPLYSAFKTEAVSDFFERRGPWREIQIFWLAPILLAALQPKIPKQEKHQQIEAIHHFLQHFWDKQGVLWALWNLRIGCDKSCQRPWREGKSPREDLRLGQEIEQETDFSFLRMPSSESNLLFQNPSMEGETFYLFGKKREGWEGKFKIAWIVSILNSVITV